MALTEKQTLWIKEGFRREVVRLERTAQLFESDPETAAQMVTESRDKLKKLAMSLRSHAKAEADDES